MSATLTQSQLTDCDREPIHTPGSIQPHGMMLVAERANFHVRYVAGEVERRLGVAAWQGESLSVIVGDVLANAMANVSEERVGDGFVGQLRTPDGETLDVTAHFTPAYLVVELESASNENPSASLVINRLATAAEGFERALSLPMLCDRAAIAFRRLTAFDRVMVYCLLEDGAGKVMAEDRRAGMHSFLNHHFPASDIPVQARALYLRNAVRVIPDANYQPVGLRPAWSEGDELDMSDCNLRSVSPVHLEYLRNMGVSASASFSIIKDGVLWGLVACHNHTPRLLSYDVRTACRSLAGSLGRWIKAKEEAEGYRQRIRLRGFEDDTVALLSREGSLDEALANHLAEICRMQEGTGVAVLRGRELVVHGKCPAENDILALVKWLVDRPFEPVFSTASLSTVYPAGAGFSQTASGVLAVTLSAEEPWVLVWFRAEQLEVLKWAGNPQTAMEDRTKPLTPRASFEAWSETVRGRARGWSLTEVAAAMRLRAVLLEVRQARRLRDLNHQLTTILRDKDVLLQQKEFLVTEVNHRTQNSLQLVSSFLSAQARGSANADLTAALEEARRRISAVALVHRRLYRGDQVDVVDVGRYIEELCEDTFSFMGEDWKRHLVLALAPMQISTDQAIPLGLILTELLINANKYAYAGAAGPIEVALTEDRTHFQMIVSDRGPGRSSKAEGFGSRIMAGLVKQLGGVLSQSNTAPGFRVSLAVPLQAPKSIM
jgi:two-component system, chemotaxis family, sensor kinase Cph1